MSKERPRNKRKNPPRFRITRSRQDACRHSAGNLLVTSALMGASLEEKMLISSLIPAVLKIIRGTPGLTTGALDKLFPEGAVFALDGLGELTRAPVTANAEPKAEPDTPETGRLVS